MGGVPAEILQRYWDQVGHGWQPVPEFTRRRIRDDVSRLLQKGKLRGQEHLAAAVLATIATRDGDHDAAVKYWREGLRYVPDDAKYWNNLAVAYENKGDRAAALETMLTASEKHVGAGRGDIAILCNLAQLVRSETGQFDLAADLFREAVGLIDPANPLHYLRVADTAAELGDYALGLEFLSRYVALRASVSMGGAEPLAVIEAHSHVLDDLIMPKWLQFALESARACQATLAEPLPIDPLRIDDAGLDGERAAILHDWASARARATTARLDELSDGE